MGQFFILGSVTVISKSFVDILLSLRGTFVLAISLLTIGLGSWQVFVSGQDKSTLINKLIGLTIFITAIYGWEKVITFIEFITK